MKKFLFLLVAVCIVLTSCENQENFQKTPLESQESHSLSSQVEQENISSNNPEDHSESNNNGVEIELAFSYTVEDETVNKVAIFNCPDGWHNEGGCLSFQGKKIMEFRAWPLEDYREYLNGIATIEEKSIGGNIYKVFSEEYNILNQETKEGEQYLIVSYNLFDEQNEVCYSTDFFYNINNSFFSPTDFEKILTTMEICDNQCERKYPQIYSKKA